MAELSKIRPTHLRREAWVYVRQSTMTQVRENTESLNRQYELAERANRLGWPADRVRVVDDDLGCSGAEASARAGFQGLVAGRIGPGRAGAGHRGVPVSAPQCRLVSLAGSVCDDRHPDRRRRRTVSPRRLQRSAASHICGSTSRTHFPTATYVHM